MLNFDQGTFFYYLEFSGSVIAWNGNFKCPCMVCEMLTVLCLDLNGYYSEMAFYKIPLCFIKWLMKWPCP